MSDINTEFEVGICDRCGLTGWLAEVNGLETCLECEEDIVLNDAERRAEDLDDGIIWEDDF